jgi:cellulose biosynthesis protein BcsQ
MAIQKSLDIKDLHYQSVPQFTNRLNLKDRLKVIVNTQHKGGVGKTTDTILQAHYIATILKKRVLLIDLDPQGNLSTTFTAMEKEQEWVDDSAANWMPPVHPDHKDSSSGDGRYSFVDLFQADETGHTIGLVPYSTTNPNIDIIPAHSSRLHYFKDTSNLFRAVNKYSSDFAEKSVKYMESEKYRKEFRDSIVNLIVDSIDAVRVSIEDGVANGEAPIYDYIIFDTSPDKDLFIEAVIRSSDHVVLPYYPDAFTLDGMASMIRMIDRQNNERSMVGKEPTSFSIQPNKISSANKKQLKDLDTFASHYKAHMNWPIKNYAAIVELWNYRPDKAASFVQTFKSTSKEYKNIVTAMCNIFGEE